MLLLQQVPHVTMDGLAAVVIAFVARRGQISCTAKVAAIDSEEQSKPEGQEEQAHNAAPAAVSSVAHL